MLLTNVTAINLIKITNTTFIDSSFTYHRDLKLYSLIMFRLSRSVGGKKKPSRKPSKDAGERVETIRALN